MSLVLKQALLFQLGNGGMDPGTGPVQVPGDRLLFGPYPAVLVGICGKRAIYGFGGDRKAGNDVDQEKPVPRKRIR